MQRSRMLSQAGRFLGSIPIASKRILPIHYRLGQLDYGTDEQSAGAQTASAVRQLLSALPQGSAAWISYTNQLDNCLSMLNSNTLTGVVAGGTCLYSLYQSVRDYLDRKNEEEAAAQRAKDAERIAAEAKAKADAAAAAARASASSDWPWILAGGAVVAAVVAFT